MQSIKFIALDMDNTLLNTKKELTPRTANVLNQLKSQGILIVFASARPERALHRFFSHITPHYVIANCGADLFQNGICLHRFPIPYPTINEILSTFLSSQHLFEYVAVETGEVLYTTYHGSEWEPGWGWVHHNFSSPIQEDIIKICPGCYDDAFIRKVIAAYPSLSIHAYAGESLYTITHKEATKENNLSFLANIHGFSLENILSFGDDDVDVGMLSSCGIGVAVSNASASAKNAATYICPSCDEEGVAQWLETHLL
ncbi:Cof-type HAD-IIB family hydrolase [Eubacteriales bacterium OttesenSCG-928-M02]|nr:Cof-type HAD-IIB family hydrolase [Eubacteriales bacterium OttesenSCG-928-M02]